MKLVRGSRVPVVLVAAVAAGTGLGAAAGAADARVVAAVAVEDLRGANLAGKFFDFGADEYIGVICPVWFLNPPVAASTRIARLGGTQLWWA
jgi:hypothetical protein